MTERKVTSIIAMGALVVLVCAALIVGFLFEVPQIAWLVLLAAAILLIDVVLTLGIRQWLRDRLGMR